MAIDPSQVDTVTVNELNDKTPTLQLLVPISDADGLLSKATLFEIAKALNYLLLPPAPEGTDTRGVQYSNSINGAVRMGGSDLTPQDDQKNYGVLLPSANWWGDPANIGVYSFAVGRNGAAFAPYSAAFGHDCVIYGTAALAGGAGSIAGDPDSVQGVDANQNAYCSIVFGKNLKGKGAKSASFGEEGGSGSRANFTAGYYAITNEEVAGIGTSAIGYNVSSEGDGGFSYGQWNDAKSRAQLLGSGINDGTRMSLNRRALGLGVNTFYPTMIFEAADGTTNGRSNIGIGLYGELAQSLFHINGHTTVSGGEEEIESGAKGVHFTFNGNTGFIQSIEPGVSWQNLTIKGAKLSFYIQETEAFYIAENQKSFFTGTVSAADGILDTDLVTKGQIKASASPNSATVSAGSTPTKSEFDALLAELRDLKTKMRSAGLLAT